MKYIPYLYSLEGELTALQNQNYSKDIIPLVNIVKDKKSVTSSKSILDNLEKIITNKTNNMFFINIPMNLELSKKNLKNPIEAFYKQINLDPNYQISILKKFSKFPNVIPVIDVCASTYSIGDLAQIRSNLNATKVAYIFSAKKSTPIFSELSTLITSNDIFIYDLDSYDFFKKSIKNEIQQINTLKRSKKFKSIVIKQIYNDLTFFKLPNGEITSSCPGYDCIDSDFIDDFSSFNFDYFGDHCSIRNVPIYKGGQSYPSFIGLHPNKFSHFGFIGKQQDINSHSSHLLPNISSSNYWNAIITSTHKNNCYGCSQINYFLGLSVPKGKSNPINNAKTWKTISISHYISMMDYKLNNNLIS